MSAPLPRNDLIACPACDAVFTLEHPEYGKKAICTRCKTVLISPRKTAGKQIIALSVSTAILIIAASVFPFLTIHTAGFSNSVSILDAALVFTDGALLLLSLTTAALIFFIPLLRVLLSVYVLAPLVMDRPAAPFATRAFRLSEALRPWSMAEVFTIGCAVALIKVSALAEVLLGPAFWMFSILVILVVVQETFICRWSIWNALNSSKRS